LVNSFFISLASITFLWFLFTFFIFG
jgi:hypothetical protein